ncbi:hypothetical protein [Tenacibaculum phage Larrie]|nr:hypothetical protein [Tenacibaculum phage Larrie]
MKKILTILFAIVSISIFSQTTPTTAYGLNVIGKDVLLNSSGIGEQGVNIKNETSNFYIYQKTFDAGKDVITTFNIDSHDGKILRYYDYDTYLYGRISIKTDAQSPFIITDTLNNKNIDFNTSLITPSNSVTVRLQDKSLVMAGLDDITGLEVRDGGYRLKNETSANFGTVGSNAVDLSIIGIPTGDTGLGATGLGSFASGNLVRASGSYSRAGGLSTESSGDYSSTDGRNVTASGEYSRASGYRVTASGDYVFAHGRDLIAPPYAMSAFGTYNDHSKYTTYSTTSFDERDLLAVWGNGESSVLRSNALEIFKNGIIRAPSLELNEISDNKDLVTLEKSIEVANNVKKNGSLYYADSNTSTTPISVTANTEEFLTNDEAGANTNKNFKPDNVSELWDSSTNSLVFGGITQGSNVLVRVDLEVTTTSVYQTFDILVDLGVGVSPYTLTVDKNLIKDIGTYNISSTFSISTIESFVINSTGKIKVLSDSNAILVVKGFDFNVNIR